VKQIMRSHPDRSALRYRFEPLSLFGPQKCRLGTGTRRFTWHCPSLCVLRLGRRFGHRSRDDLCRARITLLGCNQCRPAPVARRRRATMDSCGNAGSLSCANWLVVVLLLSWNPVSGGSSGQQILSWSRIAAPRAFPSSKNNPGSYSRRRLRWGYNSGTSRKAVSG
jgi:hypothetical protein